MWEGCRWCCFVVMLGCSPAPRAEPPPRAAPVVVSVPEPGPGNPSPPPAEVLGEDRALVTRAGDTLIAPARFRMSEGEALLLEAPEGDLRLAVVEVEAQDGVAAATAAFAVLDPSRRRAVESTRRLGARGGWEERVEVTYVTSPGEHLAVRAVARRKGSRWAVLLLEGSRATLGRRQAAVDLVNRSFLRKGYVRENLAGRRARTLDAASVRELTDFVEEARVLAEVPGVAFSVVQGERVLFEGGFGVREIGKPAKVDADTLFVLASNTKALTTLLLASLVDQGKFSWDTPVVSVYPDFRLGDEEATRRVTIRHLVCACTGLPRKDAAMFFEFQPARPAAVFERLRATRPTSGFGEIYQYSNDLAAAAGYVAGYALEPQRELGAAYDAAMRARVFRPLGMRTTTFDSAQARRGNHAEPHTQDLARKTVVGPVDLLPALAPIRPTGGAWSSARELTRYVMLELRKGALDNGRSLVSSQNLLERRKKQVAMDADTFYGMGLRVRTDWGTPVVFHGGNWLGFQSQLFFLPEYDLGGVILTNSDSGSIIRPSIIRRVVEVALGANPEAREDLALAVEEYRILLDRERAGVTLPPDAAGVAMLAARYHSDELGPLAVVRAEAGVRFDFGEWSSEIATRREPDGTLSFLAIDPGKIGFEFQPGTADGLRTLVHRELQHTYRFVEVK